MEDIFEIVTVLIIGAIGLVINMVKKLGVEGTRRTAEAWTKRAGHPYAQEAKTEPAAEKPSPPPAAYKPPEPTVHVHLEPDCEIHDQPGSLGAVSDEGKDPCHEEQLNAAPAAAAVSAAPAGSGLKLEWTGDSLVKAFVMQEILARPCQRRR